MELLCSICGYELDICVKWPRLIPNTGDTICQQCVQAIVDETIEAEKIVHLQNDLSQLRQIKQNQLKLDDFPLNQSLLRILQLQKPKVVKPINLEQKMNNQTFDEWPSEETSIDSNFLDELATSVKKPQKLKRFRDNDESFGSLNYSICCVGKQPQQQLCQAHRRQLEVVCLQCQTMICTNCALFGQHKGHYIYSEEDVISLLEMKASELTEMIEKIYQDNSTICKQKNQNELQDQLNEKQKVILEKVKREFNELREKIDQKEKNIVSQINSTIQQNINTFLDWFDEGVSTIEKESQNWIKQAQNTFERFTEQVKYWELLNLTDTLRNQGLQIQSELKKVQQQLKIKKDTIINKEINIKCNWNQIKIEEFCKIGDNNNNMSSNEHSPYLLGSFQMQQSIEETDLLHDVSATFANEAEQTHSIKRVYRSATPNQITENSEPSLSPIETNRMSITRKKSQVPMKLQMYMDDLKKGKSDVAEFIQLEKDLLIIISNEIKHWKIKSLKIMKSKINDDQVTQLFKALLNNEHIQTVNLSQNQLTDKCIDTLYQLYTNGLITIHLKNIIVSQNKINARNVKQKIIDLKKLGLIVTL